MRQQLFICSSIAISIATFFAGTSFPAEDVAIPQLKLGQLLTDLDSNQFDTRIKASRALKSLGVTDLANMARMANEASSAETVIRILAELDNRYASNSHDNMFAASDALELLATDNRSLIADTARQSLREHASKRINLALRELQTRGVHIRMGAMPTGRMGRAGAGMTMQILLTDEWTGGEKGLRIFDRLTDLFGPVPNFQNPRIRPNAADILAGIYLIDGNTLSPQGESRLAALIGQSAVQRRSRVALGITWDPGAMFSISSGVVIRNISKGGSADQAGLREGDLLLAIETPGKTDKPDPVEQLSGQPRSLPGDDTLGENRIPLRDFDDLVTRLKDYDKGDVIKLRVIRGARDYFILQAREIRLRKPDGEELEEPRPEIVDVKLKGWEELGTEWEFPYKPAIR